MTSEAGLSEVLPSGAHTAIRTGDFVVKNSYLENIISLTNIFSLQFLPSHVTVWVCILQVLPPAGKMETCHLFEMMIQDRNISVLKIIQHINEGLCPLWASYA